MSLPVVHPEQQISFQNNLILPRNIFTLPFDSILPFILHENGHEIKKNNNFCFIDNLMSGNKQNVNRIPQDELAMRSILKDMGVTGTVKES